jgi:SPP1 gp7 family putative phage head morphogenesis protein
VVSKQQQTQIDRLMRLRQTAMATIFAQAAREMSMVASKEALSGLAKTGYTVASAEGITDKIVADYTRNILNGGTDCIERVLTLQPNGMYKATTRQTFVPWLADMSVRDTSNIITLIGDAEQAGVHPRQIAKELEAYFEGTKHNAMTAARTEASKIRNDARSASFEESGVKYVEYVTAGDELVRPEHAMRNGKIYRHDSSPLVGEFNCRCLLVPADWKVNRKGAKVTQSDAEYLTKEQVGMVSA